MKRWMIFPALALALAVIGSAGFLGFRSSQAQATETPPAPPTVAVSRGDVELTVTGPGQSVDAGETILESRVNARVEELNVRPGDTVSAGQVLASLGDRESFEAARTDAQIKVLEAQKELDGLDEVKLLNQAELDLLQAQKDYDKAKNRRGSADYQRGSQANIERARADYLFAEQQFKDAEQAYSAVSGLAESDYQRVTALSHLAEMRTQRDRAKINLNYLEGKPSESEIAEADANLALAEAALKEARRNLERVRSGQSPERALAEAKLANAQAALQDAQADLDSLEVKAPFDGIVLEVEARTGQSIAAGTPLITLTNPEAQEVEVTVVEEDLPLVEVGQPVELFFDALPETGVSGKISRIIPKRVEGERAVYKVVITLDDIPEHLVAGMTVDASIVIAQQEAVLRLPRSVIRAHADGTAEVDIWVGDHTEKRTIQVGMRGDSFVEVVSGLDEGELVVAR